MVITMIIDMILVNVWVDVERVIGDFGYEKNNTKLKRFIMFFWREKLLKIPCFRDLTLGIFLTFINTKPQYKFVILEKFIIGFFIIIFFPSNIWLNAILRNHLKRCSLKHFLCFHWRMGEREIEVGTRAGRASTFVA